MYMEHIGQRLNAQCKPVGFEQYKTTQAVVHGIKNLAKVSCIQLDNDKTVLLAFPASNDVRASAIMKKFGSQSFKKLNEKDVISVDEIALCKNLERHDKIVFCDQAYRSGWEVSLERLAGSTKIDFFEFSGPKKYKARVKHVAPSMSKEDVFKEKRCFLGFSLDSATFEGNRLEAVLKWIDAHFEECTVLIADSIHVNTIRMDSQVSVDEAEVISQRLARNAEMLCGQLCSKLNHCTFHLRMSSEFVGEQRYLDTLVNLYDLYDQCKTFSESVDHFSLNFSTRKNVARIRLVEFSKHYLLQELAVTRCLVDEGWKVLVYPGELNAFDEIANGIHPQVPDTLKRLVSISLAFRPAGQESA